MTSRGSISLSRLFAAVTTLGLAWLITAAPATAQQAYITNAGDNTVSVINTATDTVVATITVGASPRGVAVSPDGLKVYVANSTGASVSVINAVTNTVVATIQVHDLTFGAAISPDGKTLFVSGANGIHKIDTATNAVTTPIPGAISGVVVTPDGKVVWFGSQFANAVGASDAITNASLGVGFASLSGLVVGLAVAPDGTTTFPKIAYAAVEGFQGGLQSFILTRPSQLFPLQHFQVGSSFGVATSPDGKRLYLTNDTANEVSIWNSTVPQSIGVVKFILVGHNPKGVAVTPDSKKVYVANQNDDTVSVIDTATNPVTTTINVGSAPIALGEFIAPVALFAGTPGSPNCHGQSVSALAQKYGGMAAAATALGVSSVSDLQNAIDESCGTATQ